MENYLLDTNHAATLVTLRHPLRQRVLLRLQAGDIFALTVPVITETPGAMLSYSKAWC